MAFNRLKEGVYWVGAVDWSIRNFHGYTTNRGSTYNAYLIIDEKIALVDTVKAPFSQELLDRISEIVDPAKIDYIISNHVEMDHSGSLPAIVAAAPNAKVITSSPSGIKGLSAHYGTEFNYQAVKAGDVLNLGKRTLEFIPTPMVHWPDNMVTYCKEDKILFSNDAFGQHYASSRRFDDEVPIDEVNQEAAKYYANIVLPYGAQALKALDAVKGLEIDIIAPSHGIIWRKYIKEITADYRSWGNSETNSSAVVVFDSMWHSTEMMAFAIYRAFERKGIPVKLLDLKAYHISDIMAMLLSSKYIVVGSPTINNSMMPTVAAFLTYMKGLAPKNRLGFAFGSYGWSGQSIGLVEDVLKDCGIELMMDKKRIPYIPTKEQLNGLTEAVMEKL